ncbi:xanthine dehydrogenase family protein subunit M [Litorivicinus sp.]|jgi:carbon-monoxide dehydrogenase medium subunit|nr:xanthine dehydrogenase family protein subunit M [Litorivicinus sp.]
MIPPSFEYHRPSTVDEAIGLLSSLGSEAKILAGGHSLLPMMKLRFAQPEHLVDINRIPELKGVRVIGDDIVIGAMTSENAIIADPALNEKVPLLPEAAKLIADPIVRNRGTIGGDIAHGDPANDHPAIALACDAVMTIAGPEGIRQVAASDFFLGTYWTALEENDILTAITMKAFPPGAGYSYKKLKRKIGDWATAACAVVVSLSGGKIDHVRITLTNLGPTALRAHDAEEVLLGQTATTDLIKQAADRAMAICDPAEDLRGDPEYKTAMAGQMVQRAISEALSRAN